MSEAGADSAFEALLEFLKRGRGLDFTGYKRASLERRFRRRMEMVEVRTCADYLDYLEVHPDEYQALFDTLLINVTEFFRDPPVWEYVRDAVVPGLVAAKDHAPIRAWSAACASGQEAYTLAMVLAEVLGDEAYRRRVKIYATDIDEDALSTARHATYTANELEHVPVELRQRYFERDDQRFAFRKDLRRTVIFGRNNLVSDAPISRLDLLVCRNTLMYFNAETQARVLRNFHFALNESGILLLGKSEMMVSNRDLFAPVDLRRRVFRRQVSREARQRVSALVGSRREPDAEVERLPVNEQAAREAALELSPEAQVVLTQDAVVSYANRAARSLLDLAIDEIGRPLGDLALARRPAELRASVEEALRARKRIAVGEVGHVQRDGQELRLDVAVTPLLTDGGDPLGAVVTYLDVTRAATLRSELEAGRRDLELAYEELQSTIDELETTNEELQSANEELQTTNEELQSTNEELETMNEELQSTNEELETLNDELRDRTRDLNHVNEFLETILASLGVGVAVLDTQQAVQVWTRRAEDLWGVRTDEAVDRHFLSLDIGLPTEQLAPGLRAVLAGNRQEERLRLDAVNRRGRNIRCTVTILPLEPAAGGREDGHPRGVIVLMEDGGPAAASGE